MDITLEQVERLREKAPVSYEEARALLEQTGGSLLDALILLERQGRIAPGGGASARWSTRPGGQERPGEAPPGPAAPPPGREERSGSRGQGLRDLLRRSVENSLEIWRHGELMVSIPLLISILLLVVAFWLVIPLLAVGLLMGCRCKLAGPDFDRSPAGEQINRAAAAVGDTMERMKEQARDHFHGTHPGKK